MDIFHLLPRHTNSNRTEQVVVTLVSITMRFQINEFVKQTSDHLVINNKLTPHDHYKQNQKKDLPVLGEV